MTKNTILPPELIPRLIPLEYCTIERAARMLKIEVDDIKHFNEAKYIPLYIKSLEKVEAMEWDEIKNSYIDTFISAPIFKSFCTGGTPCEDHEIYIMQEGLQLLFDAIYENIPLIKVQAKIPDKLNDALNERKSLQTLSKEQKDEINEVVKEATGRLTNPQKDFMSALINLLPELKDEIESNKSQSTKVMDDWLDKAGLPKVELGENNYTRWIVESNYTRELTIRKNNPNILTSK